VAVRVETAFGILFDRGNDAGYFRREIADDLFRQDTQSGAAFDEALPCGFDAGAERRYQSHACHNDPIHHFILSQASMPRYQARMRAMRSWSASLAAGPGSRQVLSGFSSSRVSASTSTVCRSLPEAMLPSRKARSSSGT